MFIPVIVNAAECDTSKVYIDSISILLSDNERFEIITALTIHCNEKLKGWSNKIDSLTIISNKNEGTTLH